MMQRDYTTGELEFFSVGQIGDAPDGEFMTTSQVLNLLDISETTLARRVRKGLLTPSHAIRRGSVRANYFRREDVLRLTETTSQRAVQESQE